MMNRSRWNLLHAAWLLPIALAVPAPDDGRTSALPADLAPGSGDLDLSRSEMREAIGRYSTDQRSLSRSIPVASSPAARKRLEQFYRGWQGTLDRLDFDAMGRDGRIDYLLLRNAIDNELRQLEIRGKRADEVAALVPFAPIVVGLEEARRRMEPVDPRAVAGQLADLKKRADASRKDLEASLVSKPKPDDADKAKDKDKEEGEAATTADKPAPISKSLALRAATSAEGLRATLGRWHGFYSGYDPLYNWWAAEPYKEADAALKRHVATLREKVAGIKPSDEESKEGREIVGDPIGREALVVALASELIPYTPEELIAVAEKELAWCEAEMRKASNDLGLGDDWKQAMELVKTRFVEPGRQPALIHDLAVEAIDFLDRRDLVTIPPLARETWGLEMMSPQDQLVNPFFVYGGGEIVVSFPTDTMTHEQKMMSMRGNNPHFARATVQHELIPGHHLQGFMSQRHRAYRAPFRTPFSVEGWALYWELRLWDLGFPRSPEDRVGMLFWRMHRCARIIFSLGFHLGTMTPGQCVDFLVDRVGHERANASGEVRRSFDGNYGPLYQAAYLLGGLQLRALHDELVPTGRMTEKAFHDAVLKENPIPIAMVRASLAGIDLDRDGKAASWKFYGPDPGKR